jgi:hypothetical protein
MRGMVFILFARLGPETGPVFASSVTQVGAPQIVARAILQRRNKLASVCCCFVWRSPSSRFCPQFCPIPAASPHQISYPRPPRALGGPAFLSRRFSLASKPNFQVLLFLSFDVPPIYAILFLRPALTPFILSLWSSFSASFVGKRVSGMGYEQMCGASERTHAPVALRHS